MPTPDDLNPPPAAAPGLDPLARPPKPDNNADGSKLAGDVDMDTGRTQAAQEPPLRNGNVDNDLTGKPNTTIFGADPEARNRPAPVIDHLDRTRFEYAGGETVTILGSGFTDAKDVLFGGVPGRELHVVDDGKLTVTTPEGSQRGPSDVVVITPAGRTDPSPVAYI